MKIWVFTVGNRFDGDYLTLYFTKMPSNDDIIAAYPGVDRTMIATIRTESPVYFAKSMDYYALDEIEVIQN